MDELQRAPPSGMRGQQYISRRLIRPDDWMVSRALSRLQGMKRIDESHSLFSNSYVLCLLLKYYLAFITDMVDTCSRTGRCLAWSQHKRASVTVTTNNHGLTIDLLVQEQSSPNTTSWAQNSMHHIILRSEQYFCFLTGRSCSNDSYSGILLKSRDQVEKRFGMIHKRPWWSLRIFFVGIRRIYMSVHGMSSVIDFSGSWRESLALCRLKGLWHVRGREDK